MHCTHAHTVTCGLSLVCVRVISIHGHRHAHLFLSVLFLVSLYFVLKSFFHLFLIPAMVPDENSMEDPLCNSSFGSMVSLDYVTPDTVFDWLRWAVPFINKDTPCPSSKFSHPNITIGFSGANAQDVVFVTVHVDARAFGFGRCCADGCYTNAFREPVLLCNTSGAFLSLPSTATTTTTIFTHGLGAGTVETQLFGQCLGFTGTPKTCCRGRWVIVCAVMTQCISVGVVQYRLLSAHSLGTSTPTSLLDTAVKTVIPHDLRGNWTFVSYTAVLLRILANRVLLSKK